MSLKTVIDVVFNASLGLCVLGPFWGLATEALPAIRLVRQERGMKLNVSKGPTQKQKGPPVREDDPWARVMGLAAELNSSPEPPSSPEPEQEQFMREGRAETASSTKDRERMLKKFRSWASDKRAVAERMERHRLKERLSQGKPLVKISGFLPPDVAAGALEVIRGCPEEGWESANADEDAKQAAKSYGAGSTGHEFDVGDGDGGSDMKLLMEVVAAAMPEHKIYTLQAARYRSGGYIEPHDDAAYTDAVVDGKKTLCSREYAIIFYLTKDWDASCGGCLVDHKAVPPKVLLPEFNSIVSFRVPRLHEVMPVTGNRARFSIFGWFLAPGRLYKVKGSAPSSAARNANDADARKTAAAETRHVSGEEETTRPSVQKSSKRRESADAAGAAKPKKPKHNRRSDHGGDPDDQNRGERANVRPSAPAPPGDRGSGGGKQRHRKAPKHRRKGGGKLKALYP